MKKRGRSSLCQRIAVETSFGDLTFNAAIWMTTRIKLKRPGGDLQRRKMWQCIFTSIYSAARIKLKDSELKSSLKILIAALVKYLISFQTFLFCLLMFSVLALTVPVLIHTWLHISFKAIYVTYIMMILSTLLPPPPHTRQEAEVSAKRRLLTLTWAGRAELLWLAIEVLGSSGAGGGGGDTWGTETEEIYYNITALLASMGRGLIKHLVLRLKYLHTLDIR